MLSYIFSMITGWCGVLVTVSMLVLTDQDYMQARYIAFVAVMFAASAVFRFLAVWEIRRGD